MLSIGKNGSARAAQTQRARNASPMVRYRIDGEYFSRAELALRLGVTESIAAYRMKKLQGASGAVTIARLAAL